MINLKGWKTRIFNIVAALVALAVVLIQVLSDPATAGALAPVLPVWIMPALLSLVIIGNAILRELTNTPAGSPVPGVPLPDLPGVMDGGGDDVAKQVRRPV